MNDYRIREQIASASRIAAALDTQRLIGETLRMQRMAAEALRAHQLAWQSSIARIAGEVLRVHEMARRNAFGGLLDRLEQADKKAEPGIRRLAKLGWTIPLWAPVPFPSIVIERVDPAEIDGVFVTKYRAKGYAIFRKMLRDAMKRPALTMWRKLIDQCNTAFRNGDYLIVVPSLLLVLEGLLAFSPGTPKRRVSPRKIANRHFAESARFRVLIWASIEAFVEEVFQSCDFDQSRPPLLNRHWILHGRDEAAWNEADCLRLFQAIDTLSYAVNEMQEERQGAA